MDPLLHLFIANLCVAGRVKASSSSSSSSSKWSSSWLWSSGDSCIFVNRKPMQICSCRVPIGKQPSTSFETHNISELLKLNSIITDWWKQDIQAFNIDVSQSLDGRLLCAKRGLPNIRNTDGKVPTRKRKNWYVLKLNLEGRLSRLLCAKRGLAVGGHSLRARSPLSPAWPSMFLKQTKILNKIQMCEKTQIGVQAKVQICQIYINTNTSNFYRHFK